MSEEIDAFFSRSDDQRIALYAAVLRDMKEQAHRLWLGPCRGSLSDDEKEIFRFVYGSSALEES